MRKRTSFISRSYKSCRSDLGFSDFGAVGGEEAGAGASSFPEDVASGFVFASLWVSFWFSEDSASPLSLASIRALRASRPILLENFDPHQGRPFFQAGKMLGLDLLLILGLLSLAGIRIGGFWFWFWLKTLSNRFSEELAVFVGFVSCVIGSSSWDRLRRVWI